MLRVSTLRGELKFFKVLQMLNDFLKIHNTIINYSYTSKELTQCNKLVVHTNFSYI